MMRVATTTGQSTARTITRNEVVNDLLPNLFDDVVENLDPVKHFLMKRIVLRKVGEQLIRLQDSDVTCNRAIDLFIDACAFVGVRFAI